jgi:hypothetical protein
MAINVFLDTEFTDFINTELISIGLSAETGQEFYAEVPYRPQICSDFVHSIVIPLLGQIPGALTTKQKLNNELRLWLHDIRPKDHEDDRIFICFDYHADWELFIDSLNYVVPPFVTAWNIQPRLNPVKLIEYRMTSGEPHHHALSDARANKYAYEPS